MSIKEQKQSSRIIELTNQIQNLKNDKIQLDVLRYKSDEEIQNLCSLLEQRNEEFVKVSQEIESLK